MNFASVPYALLHPEDASSLGVAVGDWIELKNDSGQIEVAAHPSPLVSRGMVVVPVHFPQANPNVLCKREAKADYVQVARLAGREADTSDTRVAAGEVGLWT